MIQLLLRAMREALIEGIRTELQRLNRDVTENDGLEFFSYPERAEDFATHITADGKIMVGENPLVEGIADMDMDSLETMYRELSAIDDDQDSINAIGRAVLDALGLTGRDVVDVIQEDKTLIGTSDGRIFTFTLQELPSAGDLHVHTED